MYINMYKYNWIYVSMYVYVDYVYACVYVCADM